MKLTNPATGNTHEILDGQSVEILTPSGLRFPAMLVFQQDHEEVWTRGVLERKPGLLYITALAHGKPIFPEGK